MRAYILSIGSELVLGHLTDTNATYLAQDLAAHGIELLHVTHVGDDRARLATSLRSALDLADLVVCTGGIGPTDDDLTREAIGDVLGETPAVDQALLHEVTSFFAHRRLTMPERNAKQAWLIPSSQPLPNPVGTAPGWFVTVRAQSTKLIIAMPGVPREMHRMWHEQALPRILPLAGGSIIDTVTLKTIGIGESAAEQAIHDLVVAVNPVVATYAKDDGVHIRVTATGADAHKVRQARLRATSVIRERLGRYIWGEDNDTLASTLLRRLAASGDRLALIELGTGAAFTGILSTVSDDSGQFLGSTILPLRSGCEVDVAALATTAANRDEATLGMAVVLSMEHENDGRVDGQVTVAIAATASTPELAAPLKIRSGIADAQRRGALHASDALRRYLLRHER